ECNALELDVVATIALEPLRYIYLRHEQTARIIVTNIKHDDGATIIILRDVVQRGGTGETVQHSEADSKMIKHRGEHATHRALLADDQKSVWLLVPEIAAIRLGYALSVIFGIVPG